MRYKFFFIASLLIFLPLKANSCMMIKQIAREGAHIKVLVVTGGHDFEPAFFSIFEKNATIKFDTISHPAARDSFGTAWIKQFNVIVFYDQVFDINERQKADFLKLVKNGMGIVFLHHALVSYQDWDEYTRIRGGKYILAGKDPAHPVSNYKHDLDMIVHVTDTMHTVTRGIKEFSIHDEGYSHIYVSDSVHVLLTVSHADCSPVIGWTNHYGKARIVYILLGHDHFAFENPNYSKLIANAINWAGRAYEK